MNKPHSQRGTYLARQKIKGWDSASTGPFVLPAQTLRWGAGTSEVPTVNGLASQDL